MGSFFERLRYVKLVRKLVYVIIGCLSYPGLAIMNRLQITGTEHLRDLPRNNVLFVSNHQTYFMDVIAFLHIFCAVKWRKEYKRLFCFSGRHHEKNFHEQADGFGRLFNS